MALNLKLVDYFDTDALSSNEKHPLHDGFTNETLLENDQHFYFTAKDLLNLYNKKIDLEKFASYLKSPVYQVPCR